MNLHTKLIFLIICAGLFLTSCVKEEVTSTNSIQNEIETETEPDVIDLEKQLVELQQTFLNGDFSLTFNKVPCATGGYNYTVESPDVDLSNGEYTINWYKNTEQVIFSVGQTLECACQFGVRIEVIDQSGEIAAEDSFDIPRC